MDRLNRIKKSRDLFLVLSFLSCFLLSTMVLKAESEKQILKPLESFPKEVTGLVVDDTQESLPGVAIFIKGQESKGALTDLDGNFSITISSAEDILVFTYVGMERQEIRVGNQEDLKVVLKSSATELEEVVIEGGYGLMHKRSDMVGSAFQLKGDKITNLPASRLDEMLTGLIPGMQVEYNSNDAQARPRMNVRIRGEGATNLASSEPLWIIDGVRLDTGGHTNLVAGVETSVSPLSYLDPNEVESITVLKDPVMTTLYGADASNGVILITTKTGNERTPTLNIRTRFGVSSIDKGTRFKVLDGPQFMMLAKESYKNTYGDLVDFPFQDNDVNIYKGVNTDWSKVYFQSALTTDIGVSVRGGGKKSNYFLSAGYYDAESTLKGDDKTRFSVRGNVSTKIKDWIQLQYRSGFSYNTDNVFNVGRNYLEELPIFTPYNDDDTFRMFYKVKEQGGWKSYRFNNRVAEREQNTHKQRSVFATNHLELTLDLMKGLKTTTSGGLNYTSRHEEIYKSRENWSGKKLTPPYEGIGYSYRNSTNQMSWVFNQRVNYNQGFDKHTVSGLLGLELLSNTTRGVRAQGSGFPNDQILEISSSLSEYKGTSSHGVNKRASFFANASYNYDTRYYFSATWRKDGSSGFGKNQKWDSFWALGSSWNIHNESFFESNWLNVLKLKASFGVTGNSRMSSTVNPDGLYSYHKNYAGHLGAVMTNIWNPETKWQKDYQTNIGVRLRMFDRLDFEVEWYNRSTRDLLGNATISMTSGDRSILKNMGRMRNTGIEFTISSNNITTEQFSWDTDLNFSHNSNKITKLSPDDNGKTRGDFIMEEGKSMNAYYLIRWAGVDPLTGGPLWYDANGKITGEHSYDNRVILNKYSNPDLYGGLNNTFRYRDFSLNIMMNFEIGGYAMNSLAFSMERDGTDFLKQNQSVDLLDRWQKPGDIATIPRLEWNNTNNSLMKSTRYLYKRTHLNLRNIAFSYQVPKLLISKIGVQAASISIIGNNLAVWTPYDKKNRNSYKQVLSGGFPVDRTFSLELSLTL